MKPNFYTDYDKDKGRYNRLKIGQKVKAKSSLVDWYSSHISWLFGKKPTQGGYNEGEKEIDVEELPSVYAWAAAKLNKKMPVGIVHHYGAYDNDKNVERKCVSIEFTFKTEVGDIKYMTYVHEKDLVLLPMKRKK